MKSVLSIAALAAALFAVPAMGEDFSGAYAGVEAGYAGTRVEGSTIAGPFERTDDSAVASAVVGYRMPLGGSPVVLGAEGSVGAYTKSADMRYTASGIVGVRPFEQGMLYGRVGYGWLDGVDANAGKGLDGLVLGGGYEHKLSDAISLRADYRHVDWRGGDDFPDNTVRFDGDEITAALIWNF